MVSDRTLRTQKFIGWLMSPTWLTRLKSEEGGEATKEYHELMKTLEKELKGKDFFGGDNIGYLDIVGNVVAFWLDVMQQVLEIKLISAQKFPKLQQWIEKLLTVDVMVENRPPREELVDYIGKRFAALAAAASK